MTIDVSIIVLDVKDGKYIIQDTLTACISTILKLSTPSSRSLRVLLDTLLRYRRRWYLQDNAEIDERDRRTMVSCA